MTNSLEFDFAQFVFFHVGTPDKSRIGHPVAERYRRQALRNSSGSLAMFAAILRASFRLCLLGLLIAGGLALPW